MKKNSHETLRQFAIESILAAISSVYVFYKTCFSNATNPFTRAYMSGPASLWLLILMTLLCMLMGLVLVPPKQRCLGSAYIQAMMPLEIYALLCLSPHRPILAGMAFYGALLLSMLVTGYILFSLFKKKRRLSPAQRSLLHIARRNHTIWAVCLLIPFLLFALGYLRAPSYAASAHEKYQFAVDSRQAVLTGLDKQQWKALDIESRLDVLQAVVDIEALRLGVPSAPPVVMAALPSNTAGQYNNTRNVISINERWLSSKSVEHNLDTVLHELYHCYQHCLCDALDSLGGRYRGLLVFDGIEELIESFDDYQTNGEAYYTQLVEVQARAFAAERRDYYMEQLSTHSE